MPFCAVKSCRIKKNSVEAKKQNISFYKFPRNSELKLEWLHSIGPPGWIPNATAVVCSKHFDDSNKAKGNVKLLKGAIPTLNLYNHVDEEPMANSVDGENQPILTQMQEEENENVPSSEDTFIPMEIKIETFEVPSNDLLGEERMVIVDIVKSIMCSLDLLVKSDPDILRSSSVRIKITEALFCYRHIVDDKNLNLALSKEFDEHQPPNEIVTLVNVRTKEEERNNYDIFNEVEEINNFNEGNNPDEYYEEVDFLAEEEEEDPIDEDFKDVDILTDEESFINEEDFKVDLSSDEEDPEWESIKCLRDQIESKGKIKGESKKPVKPMSLNQIKKLVEKFKNGELDKSDKAKEKNKSVDSVKKKNNKRGRKRNEINSLEETASKQNTSVEATGGLVEFKVNEEVKMDVVLFVSAIPRFVCQICDVTLVSEHHLAVHKPMCRKTNFYYGNPKLEDFWNGLKCPLCDVKCNYSYNLRRHFISHRIQDIESGFEAVKVTYFDPNDVEKNMKLLSDFILEFEKLDEQQLDSLPSNQETTNSLDNEKSENSNDNKTQTKKISHYIKFNLKKIVYDIDFDKGLYCNSCDMMFNSKDELEVHKKKVNDTDAFVCNHCDKTFDIPTKLMQHAKTHSGLFNPKSLYLNFKAEDSEGCPRQLDYKIYACKYCLQMFVQEISLRIHKKHMECKKKTQRGANNIYKRRPEDNKYHCDKCEKTFKSYTIFREHLALHIDQTIKYFCECGKGFKSKLRLQYHTYGVHGNKRYVVCEVCGINILYSNYRRHKIGMHSDLAPYQCNYCNKAFKYKVSLEGHIRTHTKEKPWRCKYCGAKFSEKRTYNTHINIHEGKTPYKCNQCTSTFVSKVKLNKHMFDHKDCRV